MSHSTKKPFAEQLHSLNSTEEKNIPSSNSPEYDKTIYQQIPGTPFMLVGNKDNGYMAVYGNYKLTDRMKSMKELIEYVDNQPWQLIMNVIGMMIEITEKINKMPPDEQEALLNMGKNMG